VRPGRTGVRPAAAARAAFAALASILALACGGSRATKVVGVTDDARNSSARRALPPTSQAVVGHMIGTATDRTLGPFLARRADGKTAVAAWVTPAEGTGRRVVAVPLSGVGEPRGASRVIANVGVDTTMLVVKPIRGPAPGFALAWTVLTDRGEALWSVVVGDDGAPRGKPIELARTADDVVWVDVIPTDLGAVCVWAEETRGGDANLLAAALDTDGRVRAAPSRVANAVAGWHALEIPGGVGVSTVAAPSGVHASKPGGKPPATAAPAAAAKPAAAESQGGALSFLRLDMDGHVTAPPASVVAAPVVSGDVEVARVGDRYVFVWTDRTGEEPAVALAALSDDGRAEPARRILEARGGAALLGVASGPAGAAVLWEAPARRAADTRRVYSARILPTLGLEPPAPPFEAVGRAAPEIVATPSGFAILAPLRDCEAGSAQCPDALVVPTVIRTDEHARPIQREPFTFGTDPASMAWGITCGADVCLALAASGAVPTRVRAAEVRPRTNVKTEAEARGASPDGPRVADITAIVSGESIVDMASTRIGDASMLAMLSAKADAPGAKARTGEDARNTPLTLSTRVIDVNGALSAPVVLTSRALAVGGVAIAPAEKPEDGAAVAWVARDNGDPEVHVTKVDRKGKKTGEVQLTTVKGDASDVAIVWAGAGWIVAWVDGRDGNGEVYATKLGADLSRNAGERITNAPGDASDLVAVASGDVVWLAWADPRESPRDGMADVFVAGVRAKDAKRAVEEQRLLATAAHSRTPQLALASDGSVHIAWIEEAPMGIESPTSSGYGAMWATLAEGGKIVRRPTRLPLGGEGAATAVAMDPHGTSVRVVVARSSVDAISVDALDLGASDSRAYPLLTLDGPPSLDVAMLLDGGTLYFNDDGPSAADKRARRARIAWSR